MLEEKVKKVLEPKEWKQEPYKGVKFLGIDLWFWISILFCILWFIFIARPIFNQELFPTWTKITLLGVSFGAGIPLIVGSYQVQFRKGVK